MKFKFKNFNIGLYDKKNKIFVYCIGIIVLLAVIILFATIMNKGDKTFLLQLKEIEHTSIANGYVIKQETIIQRDAAKTLIPVVANGQRVSKGGIIATYKNEEYDLKTKELESLDKEILELMQNLPTVYSGEIESIENQIRDELKSAIGITSYVEMQNYINSINDLVNKRASVVGQMSPSGETIKKLISKRNEFEKNMKASSDNVVATTSGLVMYKTDGLEDKLIAENINNVNYDIVEKLVSNKATGSNIKVVDNFCCYIIARTKDVKEELIRSGKKYNIRIVGDNSNELESTLISYSINKDGYTDVVLRIENGIEAIADMREIELEIVWWNKSGLLVPIESIYYKEDVPYVEVLRFGKCVEIPIKIEYINEMHTIISNLTNELKEELGIENGETLKLYDNIILRGDNR